MPGAAVERYAPIPDQDVARNPRMVPSFLAASSTSWTWFRPWVVAWKFSLRVSAHLTGRPSRIAQNIVTKSAGYAAILLPKPPPTSGAITRSLSSGTPVTTELRNLRMCGFCVVFHTVSSPDAPLHWASAARASIACGMRRC